MKKIAILSIIMVLGAYASAFAGPGTDISWNDCVGSGLEVFNRTQACTNAGTFTMISTFVSGADIPNLGGMQWDADIITNSPTIDPWWNVTAARYSYNATNPTGGCTNATDIWNLCSTAPSGNVSIPLQGANLGNKVRLQGAQAYVAPEICAIGAADYNYNFTLQLKFSPGTAGNAGCNATACLVVNTVDLQTPDGGSTKLTGPDVQNWVTWRLGTGIACPAATPTKKATWGSIKALYR